ncbi:hypothetical protein [Streptomyces platensis]
MPTVNTPQFSWVLARFPRHSQRVPPIYLPEVAARAIAHAADQYAVGASTVTTVLANKPAPALLDHYLARSGFDSQQTDESARADRPNNLWKPADGKDGHDYGAHGAFDDHAASRSALTALARHPVPPVEGLFGAALGSAVLIWPTLRRRGGCRHGQQCRSQRPGSARLGCRLPRP